MKDVIWEMLDLDRYGPEEMEELRNVLHDAEMAVRKGEIPVATCLEIMREGEMGRVAGDLIANAAGVDTMFLDIWCDGKTRDEVARVIERERSDVEKISEIKRRGDMRDEILLQQLESGLVHIPTDLLRNMWSLGEAVSDLLGGNDKAGYRMMDVAMRVLLGTSEWVAFCKRRWGVPEDSHLLMVIPISRRDVLEARPDDPEEKVPF